MGTKARANLAATVAAHNALDSAFESVTVVGGLLHAEQIISKLKAIKERLKFAQGAHASEVAAALRSPQLLKFLSNLTQ